jgi:retron-type reverse transcriptase
LEKLKMSTPHQIKVSEIIDKYVEIGKSKEKHIFKVLSGIRNKNIKNKISNPPKHSQINNLIANPYILIQAYRTIRKNKGATTKAYILPNYLLKTFNKKQLTFIKSSYNLPDEMSWEIILAISSHIKNGTYPWGASRRIWIPKPGIKDKMRPITIPPFADKIVQEAIRMVLEAIYEPTFMHMNVSGFRASNGCHENITLINDKGQGMSIAIEGDIESAYPNLDNNILLNILSEKINDQKFLNLLRNRLNYL